MNARVDFAIEAGAASGLRRAALALHAAQAQDRDWLLGQLPGDQRPLVEKMLADLASLGLPQDRDLLDELLRPPKPPAVDAAARQPRSAQALETLCQAAATDLALLLEKEPVALAAHALALLPEPKRAPVLEHFSATRRRAVQELLATHYALVGGAEGPQVAPLLDAALATEIAARLPMRKREADGWAHWVRRWPALLPGKARR